ncbi:periplasmic binding protein [Pyrobaculum islandicum DSM 4184]|uniref:Periplasmic binding protein n=1 Tax=Pyrobaculum islandicum (strain DSM 4184 / JCM 9189 / GEO3) TaxID=384616 RepID=A1RR29_PYRIL|nr:ABC transporter substrate-binding protein [Pyrobaculum islandicum]ABL87411.1 periplasmic binding protein [Pyrobaculum islandicum DSM 4184]
MNTRVVIGVLLAVILAVFALYLAKSPTGGGVSNATAPPRAAGPSPVSVVDSAGRVVVFDKPPERVVALTHAEFLYVLGVWNRVVGIGKSVADVVSLPASLRNRTVVGDTYSGINWEAVAALKPDLVVMGYWGGVFAAGEQQVLEKSRELGYKVLAFGYVAPSVNSSWPYENIRIVRVLGKVFNVRDRAEELASWLEERYREALDIARRIPPEKRLNVLVISAYSLATSGDIYISGRGSASGELVELVGAHNVAFDYNLSQTRKLDLEKLITLFGNKTDVVIVRDFHGGKYVDRAIKRILGDPRWRAIKAVREGRVYGVNFSYYDFSYPYEYSPRFISAIYALGHLIYPQYYPDWRPIHVELLRRFYNMSCHVEGGLRCNVAQLYPVTVMDSMGREVTFESPPRRVIVLYSGWAEALYVLGVVDRVVGISPSVARASFLPKEVRGAPAVGETFSGLNWEAVAALRPNLIIMGRWKGGFEPGERQVLEKSRELGYKVLAFGITDVNKTGTKMPYENIRIIRALGRVFNVTEKAEALADFLEREYKKALEIARGIPPEKRRNVLVIYPTGVLERGPISVSYRGSAYAETVELVGGHNVAFDYNFTVQYPKFDLEKLIALFGNKTDVLIVAWSDYNRTAQAVKAILSDPRWRAIKAVREGRVYGVVLSAYSLDFPEIYGPRFVSAIYAFGRAIYPEYYPDWRPIHVELLRRFYNVSCTYVGEGLRCG